MENPYHHQILEEQLTSLGRVRVRQLVERHGFLRVDVAVGEFLRFFRHWAACLIISRFTIRQARPEGRMVRAPRGRAGFYSPGSTSTTGHAQAGEQASRPGRGDPFTEGGKTSRNGSE